MFCDENESVGQRAQAKKSVVTGTNAQQQWKKKITYSYEGSNVQRKKWIDRETRWCLFHNKWRRASHGGVGGGTP